MSMSDILAPPEDQSKIMHDAINKIKAHTFYMKKSLESERVLEAIKHAVELAGELKIGSLTPKNYYEVYMLAFDNLRYLSSILSDTHRSKRANLGELYEIVQYSPSIVPRLYLMITVGAAYMPMGEQPIKVILRDLIDMTRGVQHPVRGLFLRHYLSSMTKDYLPDGDMLDKMTSISISSPTTNDSNNPPFIPDPDPSIAPVTDDPNLNRSASFDSNIGQRSPSMVSDAAAHCASSSPSPILSHTDEQHQELSANPSEMKSASFHGTANDSIAFVMQNFVEMNKLWVRLQHQGSTKDRERRDIERRELRILVGTNIVRLSQLQTVDLNMYKTQILPPILDQIINCRDIIAQEYLMEVIIQVFPDAFHLHTLEPLLAVTAQLQPQVNIKQVIVALIDRLRTYATVTTSTVDTEHSTTDDKDHEEGIPEHLQLFDVFWAQISQLIVARPDLGLADISSLLLSLIQLSVACYPDQIMHVDQILNFAKDQALKYLGTPELTNPATVSNLQSLLLNPLHSEPGIVKPIMASLFLLPNDAQAFRDLLALQPYQTRHTVAVFLTTNLVLQHVLVSTESHLLALLDCIQVLVKDQKDAPLWKNTGMFVDREALGSFRSTNTGDDADKRQYQLDELGLEQALVAKFVSLIGNVDTVQHFQLLTIARKSLTEGGGFRIKHTFPALLIQAVRLVDRVIVKHKPVDESTSNSEEDQPAARQQELMHLFKYMHQLVMNIQHKSDDVVAAVHLFLVSARAANAASMEEIAYEFFVSALTTYEECINDSRVQFVTLTAIMNSLLECQLVFGKDNYDTLATKCTLHASRLLKRPDQCRAVIHCSHLFWSQSEKCREGKRVLECLQKALKFADACLDSVMNVELLIETLARYIYFYEKGCETIAVKTINSLLELIATNISNLQESDPNINSPNTKSSSDGDQQLGLGRGVSASSLVGYEVGGLDPSMPTSHSLSAVTAHFKRTVHMLMYRQTHPPKTLGDQLGPFYHEMILPKLPA